MRIPDNTLSSAGQHPPAPPLSKGRSRPGDKKIAVHPRLSNCQGIPHRLLQHSQLLLQVSDMIGIPGLLGQIV